MRVGIISLGNSEVHPTIVYSVTVGRTERFH